MPKWIFQKTSGDQQGVRVAAQARKLEHEKNYYPLENILLAENIFDLNIKWQIFQSAKHPTDATQKKYISLSRKVKGQWPLKVQKQDRRYSDPKACIG